MKELKEYLTSFSEEDKQELENLYHAIPKFFNNRMEDYIVMENGYDYWFLMTIIVPQKEKELKLKIKDMARSKTIELFPEVINMITEEALNKIISYRKNNEDYKGRALNFAINCIFLESLLEYELDDTNSLPRYMNFIIRIITTEEDELLNFLNKYNVILSEEEEETLFELYKSKISVKDFILKAIKEYII